MTQKEMLQEAYTANPKVWALAAEVDTYDLKDAYEIVEQLIATVWYKL